jgi:hypothetical protein
MTPDPLDALWRSDANEPTAAQMEIHRAAFARALASRFRRFAVAMSIAAVGLAAVTGALLLPLLRSEAVGRAEALGLAALLLLPWIALTLFVRRHLRLRDEHPDYSRSIADGLRAALADNHFARARVRTIGILHAVSLPLLGLAVLRLREAGRTTTAEAISMAALLALLLVATGVALGIRYFAHLKPRERRLQELLASYG